MYCNNTGGACLFFDIDVKVGESVVISKMLQWYNCMFFKGFPLMPKGEIFGMFSDRGRVCVFFIDGKDHDQQHNDDRMEGSEAKLHFGVSDTGSWSFKTLHHRNDEMLESRNAKNTFWCKFRIPGVGVSKHFTIGMPKCEKHLLVQVSNTGSWSVKTLHHRNAEMQKTPFGGKTIQLGKN
jgi:hypothetical protein